MTTSAFATRCALLLGRAGATVVAVESAEAARTALARAIPTRCLCDLAMPLEDGYSFVTTLRTTGPRVPAIRAHRVRDGDRS